MDVMPVEDVVRNIDRRLERVEQYLPSLLTKDHLDAGLARLATGDHLDAGLARLSTKDDLREAIANLATKAELQEALARFATKEELRAAIEPLATKAELHAESAETRTYMRVLVEDLRDDLRIMTEGVIALDARDARQHDERLRADAGFESRVTALEARERPRRPR